MWEVGKARMIITAQVLYLICISLKKTLSFKVIYRKQTLVCFTILAEFIEYRSHRLNKLNPRLCYQRSSGIRYRFKWREARQKKRCSEASKVSSISQRWRQRWRCLLVIYLAATCLLAIYLYLFSAICRGWRLVALSHCSESSGRWET